MRAMRLAATLRSPLRLAACTQTEAPDKDAFAPTYHGDPDAFCWTAIW